MIRDFSLGCQYAIYGQNSHGEWIEHPALVRQRGHIATETLAIPLYVEYQPARIVSANIYACVAKENHNVHS